MSTAVSPAVATSTAAPHRPWWRLHPFTWFAVLLTSVVLVLLIVPGEHVDATYHSSQTTDVYEHGWPWIYSARHIAITYAPGYLPPPREIRGGWESLTAWRLKEDIASFSGLAAVGDMGAALLVLFVAAVAGQAWVLTRHSWWQFRIRELLLLMAIVAGVLGWWRSHSSEVQREQVALQAWPGALGLSEYIGPLWIRRLIGRHHLPWLYRIRTLHCNLCPTIRAFGDDAEAIREAENIRAAIKDLRYVKRVNAEESYSGGDGRFVVFPPSADTLIVWGGSHDTLACVFHLIGLKHLRYEDVANIDLLDMRRLVNLETLRLSGPRVTDDGVQFLLGMQSLTKLTLNNTRVTDAGITSLHRSMPTLEIWQYDGDSPIGQ